MDEQGKKNILIIDDDAEIREFFEKFLERNGYTVFTAENGREGFVLIREDPSIQIVFCDIVMPKMDGLEFLQRVQEHNVQIQVIMITGNPSAESSVMSVENNACQYIIKPAQREDILKSIERAKRNISEQWEMVEKGVEE